MDIVKYRILAGSRNNLELKVQKYLLDGWELFGSPFGSGNKIRVSGDPAYPISCTYTREICQAVILKEKD